MTTKRFAGEAIFSNHKKTSSGCSSFRGQACLIDIALGVERSTCCGAEAYCFVPDEE